MKAFKSILQFHQHFNTETKCRKYLELQRWNGKPVCPHCGSLKVYRFTDGRRFKCGEKECKAKFSVTVGTIYENSKVPLTKWFLAMYLITAHKKGISSIQLSKDLGVTQKTAWFMLHRLREAMQQDGQILKNEVQADETYIGGKRTNMHAKKRKKYNEIFGTGYLEKTPVFGMVETKGRVIAFKVPKTDGKTLKPIIYENVEKSATLLTDGFGAYSGLSKDYYHIIINHEQGIYSHKGFHTNSIESFWSILKRGIFGIYHFVSTKHMNKYCNEFAYRYNTRDLNEHERFNKCIPLIDGKRLRYADLIRKD